MIRFLLLIRYTSTQTYKILLQKLPFPFLSLLAKLKSGSMNVINAAKMLKDKGAISKDIILMVDKIYLQKCITYAGGQYIGADSDENFYKGIVVFMIQGLKESDPILVKALSEVTLTGQWLADKVFDCITSLGQVGFKVRGIVSDNHSTNVSAFNVFQIRFPSGCFDIQHSHNSTKTYLFFDNVHLVKTFVRIY